MSTYAKQLFARFLKHEYLVVSAAVTWSGEEYASIHTGEPARRQEIFFRYYKISRGPFPPPCNMLGLRFYLFTRIRARQGIVLRCADSTTAAVVLPTPLNVVNRNRSSSRLSRGFFFFLPFVGRVPCETPFRTEIEGPFEPVHEKLDK